jgi:hypothetical protein
VLSVDVRDAGHVRCLPGEVSGELAQRVFGEAHGRGSQAQFDLREVAVSGLGEAGRHCGPLVGLYLTGVRSAEPGWCIGHPGMKESGAQPNQG